MELKILEQSKTKLVFELIGEDHTFCNALKHELWADKAVNAASYKISHPLVGIPQFIIESKDAKKSLVDAAKRLQKNLAEFKKAF